MSTQIHANTPGGCGPPDLQMALHRHRGALEAYVTHFMPAGLASKLEVTDVVQDVYVEAMRRAAEFKPNDDDHFRRWLKTIARHRMTDLVRHHQAAKRCGSGNNALSDGEANARDTTVGLLEEVALYHRTPSQSAAAHEMVALVNRSIADLPADYAQVLRLRYMDGLSGKRIADQLERTERSVNQLCTRAVTALRLQLGSSLSLG